MKVIVAGSRTITALAPVARALEYSGFPVTEVVSGGARGADRLGEEWARLQGIPVMLIPAAWGLHGKAAGPRRNSQMAAYADALVAVWDGKSRGTEDMIEQMRTLGKPVFVLHVTEEQEDA